MSQLFINGSHKSVMEVVEKMISPVLFGINRSFKRQNTISLKTGVSNTVYVMPHLHEVNVSASVSFV